MDVGRVSDQRTIAMGQPKLWNDLGALSKGDNDVHDGDLKISGTAAPYTLKIRQAGAWIDFFPRLTATGYVPTTNLGNLFRWPEVSLTTFNVRQVIETLGQDAENTAADVLANTGLNALVYNANYTRFVARCIYNAAATTTGSRWTIDGPAASLIGYRSQYGLTATTETLNYCNAYDLPAASNASSPFTTGDIAIIEGFILPTADGTLRVRFASEVSGSAITMKAGSTLFSEFYTTAV